MDQLFNAGKQFLENQNQGNNNQGNNNNNDQGGGGFDIGDIQSLVGHAQNHDSSQDSGLLSQGQLENGNENENHLSEIPLIICYLPFSLPCLCLLFPKPPLS